ncbi:unnamed protein product [Cutaneotrichosporon oleaginosum]
MVYIFGLAVVFLCVVVFWVVRALINKVRNWHRRRQPSLPPPVTQPTLSETAEHVFARFMSSTMAEDVFDPVPPPPARRRSSVYSGVVRAHPECDSDPDLPHYCTTSSPTASRPELIIIEDEDLPPPLTPRTGTPVADAPGYTTRPATPLRITSDAPPEQVMTFVGRVIPFAPYAAPATPPAPAAVQHVAFARGIAQREDMPARPPAARRKHNQRRARPVTEFAFIAAI